MKLDSLIIENIAVYDFLKRNREQIELDHAPQTYRMLQVSLMMDEEAYVRDWLIKNGYMDEEKLPFEEIYEAYSGFIRNPEDPASEPFEPTGAVAQFKEELRALFDKFKGDLKNPDFIKGVAEIMVNWKSLLRSQMEEIETPGEKNAKIVADKAKQIIKKTGKELGNLAKDVYDTPTIKRLRAYINRELEKLVDKYGVDYPGKQTKIPFPKDEMDENLRNWFKKEKWVRIDTQGNIAGKCGTMPKGKKTQRCLPRAKAQSLTKKQRAATSRKKTRSKKQFVKNTKAAKVRLKK